MKQFKTIFKFELFGYLKNKVFIGSTVVLVLLIAAVMFFPRVNMALKKDDSEQPTDADNKKIMLVYSDENELSEAIIQIFSEVFPEYEVKLTNDDLDDIKKQITEEIAECAFVLHDFTSYTYYVNNFGLYDMKTALADEALQSLYRMSSMITHGMTPDEATAILSMPIEHTIEKLGKDQMQNFFYTYIMIFALYMVILLYGQMVATNVATEKSSKAMELLITSASPTSMMFGKVIASCLAGMLQLVAVFGSAFFFFNINKSYWTGNEIIESIFDMPLELLIYMLIFFVLGFFIYAFLYGAIGSTASKLEDINTSVMPITFMFIIAFMVVMFSMSSGNVDNTIMKICSFVPFTSPMAMFTRIAMSSVPIYEIAVSIVILIASVVGVGILSAKIYRIGVVLYGTPPKFTTILKTLKRSK